MWFHIRGRDMSIFKPEGKVITFWMWTDSREKLDELLKDRDITKIEWIKEEDPGFEN